MFETVFDLSASGIIMQKTLLGLSRIGKGEGDGGVSSYTLGKQLLSGPCLDP